MTGVEAGQEYYEAPTHASEYLILDMDAALRTFVAQTAVLEFAGKERGVEHYLDDLVQYMMDFFATEDYLQEYLVAQYHFAQESAGAPVAYAFTSALEALALALREQLAQAAAWDAGGTLPYRFDRLVGSDIVLHCWDFAPSGYCRDG